MMGITMIGVCFGAPGLRHQSSWDDTRADVVKAVQQHIKAVVKLAK